MGYFENGKWIVNDAEKLQENSKEIKYKIEDLIVAYCTPSIVKWETHYENFENGKEISFKDSLVKIFEIFIDKFKFLKL